MARMKRNNGRMACIRPASRVRNDETFFSLLLEAILSWAAGLRDARIRDALSATVSRFRVCAAPLRSRADRFPDVSLPRRSYIRSNVLVSLVLLSRMETVCSLPVFCCGCTFIECTQPTHGPFTWMKDSSNVLFIYFTSDNAGESPALPAAPCICTSPSHVEPYHHHNRHTTPAQAPGLVVPAHEPFACLYGTSYHNRPKNSFSTLVHAPPSFTILSVRCGSVSLTFLSIFLVSVSKRVRVPPAREPQDIHVYLKGQAFMLSIHLLTDEEPVQYLCCISHSTSPLRSRILK